jgi:hypothetical protein
VLGERHLRRLLGEYGAYYHDDRTHPGLGKATPRARLVEPRPDETPRLSRCRASAVCTTGTSGAPWRNARRAPCDPRQASAQATGNDEEME